MVVNRGPVPIFVGRCGTVLIQYQVGDAWEDTQIIDGDRSDPTCDPDQDPDQTPPQPMLRVAPGESRVLSGAEPLPGAGPIRVRPILLYKLGCLAGQGFQMCDTSTFPYEFIGTEATYP